jgi:hypothetical protein
MQDSTYLTQQYAEHRNKHLYKEHNDDFVRFISRIYIFSNVSISLWPTN